TRGEHFSRSPSPCSHTSRQGLAYLLLEVTRTTPPRHVDVLPCRSSGRLVQATGMLVHWPCFTPASNRHRLHLFPDFLECRSLYLEHGPWRRTDCWQIPLSSRPWTCIPACWSSGIAPLEI